MNESSYTSYLRGPVVPWWAARLSGDGAVMPWFARKRSARQRPHGASRSLESCSFDREIIPKWPNNSGEWNMMAFTQIDSDRLMFPAGTWEHFRKIWNLFAFRSQSPFENWTTSGFWVHGAGFVAGNWSISWPKFLCETIGWVGKRWHLLGYGLTEFVLFLVFKHTKPSILEACTTWVHCGYTWSPLSFLRKIFELVSWVWVYLQIWVYARGKMMINHDKTKNKPW